MRLFSDGAEFYDYLFWSATAGAQLASSGLPIGLYCYHFYKAEGWGRKDISPLSEFYLRQRVKFSATSIKNDPYRFPSFRYNGNEAAHITFDGSNFIGLYVNGVEVANSNSTINASTWYIMEIYLRIADDGAFYLRLDGIPMITYDGDTRVNYSTINQIHYQGADDAIIGGGNYSLFVDDLALNDTSGSVDNSWCGQGFIEALMPTDDGDVLQWTATSGSHWDEVNEIPSDDDATYIEALTDTTKQDILNVSTFGEMNRVVARVWTESRMRDTLGGSVRSRLGVKTSGSVFVSDQRILSNSYSRILSDEFRINPMTGLAWTKSDLDALQVVLEASK